MNSMKNLIDKFPELKAQRVKENEVYSVLDAEYIGDFEINKKKYSVVRVRKIEKDIQKAVDLALPEYLARQFARAYLLGYKYVKAQLIKKPNKSYYEFLPSDVVV